eukprot:9463779-Lingulodinium_polyedra.AAC.1
MPAPDAPLAAPRAAAWLVLASRRRGPQGQGATHGPRLPHGGLLRAVHRQLRLGRGHPGAGPVGSP